MCFPLQHLNNLLENYLEPLKKETFLSSAEINALFGNIQEIVTFQRQFLQNLEEALDLEPDFHKFDYPSQFKVSAPTRNTYTPLASEEISYLPLRRFSLPDADVVCVFFFWFYLQNMLFSIGSAFLYYVNHFKLYSSFCASHSKAQKVLHPSKSNADLSNASFSGPAELNVHYVLDEGNQALQEFLSARNPKQQHSSTLESYLIKPIQRILKYPLLLQQLRNLTDSNCDEHQHLVGTCCVLMCFL